MCVYVSGSIQRDGRRGLIFARQRRGRELGLRREEGSETPQFTPRLLGGS